MDLVGYFGFPSKEHPEAPAVPSHARVNKKNRKRRSGVSSAQNKFASADSEQASDIPVHSGVKNKEDIRKPNESSYRAQTDSLESLSNATSSSVALDVAKPCEDSHLLKRRKRNSSAFTIRSTIYGQPQQLSHQQKSSRLRMGKGTSNIFCHLFRRSIMRPNSLIIPGMTSYVHSGQHWNISQTVRLDTQRISGEVSAMSFDEVGVLLATGDDRGYVRIYDFDDVNSLDISKRNEISRLRAKIDDETNLNEHVSHQLYENVESERNVSREKMKVPPPLELALSKPALSFHCASCRITDLQWNPNNQDQLAVSFA